MTVDSHEFTAEVLEPFGAVVRGLDTSHDQSATQIEAIRGLLDEHHVLVFRGHEPPDDTQYRRLLTPFGTLFENNTLDESFKRVVLSQAEPEIVRITNRIFEDGKEIGASVVKGYPGYRGLDWHTDHCFDETISIVGALDASVVTASGGETAFADMYRVYESLPPSLRSQVDSSDAVHELPEGLIYHFDGEGTLRSNSHPLVVTHPRTGRRALYVNRLYTNRIVGLGHKESRALLDTLVEFSLRPEFVFEHRWQARDLVLWDQIGTIHCRRPFDESEPRYMRQMTMLADDRAAPWPARAA